MYSSFKTIGDNNFFEYKGTKGYMFKKGGYENYLAIKINTDPPKSAPIYRIKLTYNEFKTHNKGFVDLFIYLLSGIEDSVITINDSNLSVGLSIMKKDNFYYIVMPYLSDYSYLYVENCISYFKIPSYSNIEFIPLLGT